MEPEPRKITNRDKWLVAILLGLLFLLFASPFMVGLLDSFFGPLGLHLTDSHGCANGAGLLICGILFVLVVRTLIH